ncbi:MAG TPA: DNA/RNA nuclease SfsA [Bacteroidetes bacterium]|nr:DNA/RNA nuclease SfsA [Bacteroidota bacterium]
MKFSAPLVHGTLKRRYKRFLADVILADGTEVTAHCANPGSMLSCSEPGAPVLLSEATNPARKLKYTWELIHVNGTWVCVNTQRTNALVEEALRAGVITEVFSSDMQLRREVPYGGSRVDFLLENGAGRIFLEVKNVTLAQDGRAMFPDAVTKRGQKHLQELMQVVEAGDRAVIFFLVSREDTRVFSPACHIDPDYARLLAQAVECGVELLVYEARVGPEEILVTGRMPWELDGEK